MTYRDVNGLGGPPETVEEASSEVAVWVVVAILAAYTNLMSLNSKNGVIAGLTLKRSGLLEMKDQASL